MRLSRRDFLRATAGATALGAGLGVGCGPAEHAVNPLEDGWQPGEVRHLLPTADHRRIRLKASFAAPVLAPTLQVAGRTAAGQVTDSQSRFFTFDAAGLEPDTEYELALFDGGGQALCEPWPLRTFPAPDARPERFRLLAFTCAGGPDDLFNFELLGWEIFNAYLPIADRQRLLARALSFGPDAVVANGDHVYWDMKSRFGWAMGRSPRAWWLAGLFDRAQPVLGGSNEEVMIRAFGPQIAGLYGVMLRSVPCYFLQDDHDYGENDEANELLRTFPGDPFMVDLARSTQRLYYPELLVDEGLPSQWASGPGLSESFGQLRYGALFEALLYDCRRHLTNSADPALDHAESGFVPPDVETWLVARSRHSPCTHLAHMPSTPVLWTAGKWGEWYPDAKDEAGALRADAAKPYWPPGWLRQHDRLLAALSARHDRTPLVVSGDLHATAIGRIHASGDLSLRANPVVSLLSGAVGTGVLGWPSKFRSQLPVPSGVLRAEEWVKPREENGFSLLDFTRDGVEISLFAWTPEQGSQAIERLEPFEVIRIPKPG